jgi:hypothetical protein
MFATRAAPQLGRPAPAIAPEALAAPATSASYAA